MPGNPEDILRLDRCPKCGSEFDAQPPPPRCLACGYACKDGACCVEIGPPSGRATAYLHFGIAFCLAFCLSFIQYGSTLLWHVVIAVLVLGTIIHLGLGSIILLRLRASARRHLPHRRLVITPHGYTVMKGKKIVRKEAWLPIHRVHVVRTYDRDAYRLTVYSMYRKSKKQYEFRTKIILRGEVAQVLPELIKGFIRDTRK